MSDGIGKGKSPNAFTQQLKLVNTGIRKAHQGRRGRIKFFHKRDLYEVYNRDRGQCKLCGMKLSARGFVEHRPHFEFFKPIRSGGEVSIDNLMTICPDCRNRFRSPSKLLNRIPEVNTVSHLIERVMVETYLQEKARDEGDPIGIESHRQTKGVLKRELDIAVEEIADMMHYRATKNSKEYDPKRFVLGENNIAEVIEKAAERILKDEEPEEEMTELEDGLQAVVDEQKYRIMR